ncbi:hypothetical protein STEG23_034351 [Scotinomys teguina]
MFCGFPVTSTSCLHGGLASSLSFCLALDSSSSFPCPAFRAIAKSVFVGVITIYFVDILFRLLYTKEPSFWSTYLVQS